jgi:hypothetical protein
MAIDPTGGLNCFNLISLLENLSQLSIGPNENTDDISQDLVVQFLKEGFQTIVDSETRWPWFEANYTTTVTEGTPLIFGDEQVFTVTNSYAPVTIVDYDAAYSMEGYTYEDPSTGELTPIPGIKELTNVIAIQGTEEYAGFGLELIYISQHQAERIWIGSNNQVNIPAYFSLYSNSLYLWPRPNQTYLLQIRGFRQPNLNWLSDANQNNPNSTAYVDLDNELQACLIAYTMSRIYQFQEDAEMSRVYREQFATNLKNYQDYLTAPSSNQPIVYSGGLQLSGNGYGLGPGIRVSPGAGNGPAYGTAW